jgi:hypothetical protein
MDPPAVCAVLLPLLSVLVGVCTMAEASTPPAEAVGAPPTPAAAAADIPGVL